MLLSANARAGDAICRGKVMNPIVVALTGASGAIYARRLLQALVSFDAPVCLTISESARLVFEQELGAVFDLRRFAWSEFLSGESHDDWFTNKVQPLTPKLLSERVRYYHETDFMSPIASGSFLTSAMVICPCSGSTLGQIVHSSGNSLISRAADVHLKERRKLILVPRETPVSAIQLANMTRAAELGAIVLPAAPGFYHGVEKIGDLVDFVVARMLDQLAVPHDLMKRWGAADVEDD
jgi:4-hydroxy-3-polyprenylbenzoate decarboxylase